MCIRDRRGTATLPHGYGQRYRDNAPAGPQINRLTAAAHCDPLTWTPFHKYVPVHLAPINDGRLLAACLLYTSRCV